MPEPSWTASRGRIGLLLGLVIAICFALAPAASGMACGVIALVLLVMRHVFTAIAVSAP